jgi:hypothetical protein
MSVSGASMSRMLGRLTAAMGKPFSDAKIEAQATEYARAMGQLPEYAVEWAVERAIKDSTRYPKAAELRKLAQQCPQLSNGNHDGSLRAQMQRWMADPWKEIASLDQDRTACKSSPCPVCGSVAVFSDRGLVVVHDDRLHSEAQASYSNWGRPEWLTMPALELLEPKKRRVSSALSSFPAAREPARLSEVIRRDANDGWDSAQQERAEAEQVA